MNQQKYLSYLAIGAVLFCYLLIDELKALSNPQEARPKNYYIYNISTVIIFLNIFTAFFRILSGIMIFFYITILKIVKKREEYEREERLIAIQSGLVKEESSDLDNGNGVIDQNTNDIDINANKIYLPNNKVQVTSAKSKALNVISEFDEFNNPSDRNLFNDRDRNNFNFSKVPINPI